MATKNFKIRLTNASVGRIVKDLGLITIGEAPADIVGDPPAILEPSNNVQWECVHENTGNSNVVNLVAEAGFEYMVLFEANASYSDIQLTYARFFFGTEFTANSTKRFIGCNSVDYNIMYKSGQFYSASFNDSRNNRAWIHQILRRPYNQIASENLRQNPMDWSEVSMKGTSQIQFVWQKNLEYSIIAIDGNDVFPLTGLLDDMSYNIGNMDTRIPLVLASTRENNRYIRFMASSGGRSPSDSQKSIHLSGLSSSTKLIVRSRPYTLSSTVGKLTDNQWKQDYWSNRSEGSANFNWKEGREYLIICEDSDGGNETSAMQFIMPEGALSKYGINTYQGYVVATGDHGYVKFQITTSGTKRFYCYGDAHLNGIFSRPLQLDAVSCSGESNAVTNGTFTIDDVAINGYEASTGTGYVDNVFVIARDIGISADGTIIESDGLISIICLESSQHSLEIGAPALGIMSLVRYKLKNVTSVAWSGNVTFNPDVATVDINGSSSTVIAATGDKLTCETSGLGITTQTLFSIDLTLGDAEGNIENITGLRVLVNKTVAADAGSVYLRSDELMS